MKHRVGILVLLSVFVLLAVGLALAPRLPADKRGVARAEANPVQLKIDRAVHLVNTGENPMEGIALLREVLDEDSTQIDAHWHLGQFSLTSRQFDKATERFETVVRYDTAGKYPQAYFWLGQAKIAEGQNEEAVSLLKTYLEMESDTIIREGVLRILERLEAEEQQEQQQLMPTHN